jgi:hypothetical protein
VKGIGFKDTNPNFIYFDPHTVLEVRKLKMDELNIYGPF